ncbi:fungal-specific transcription factor domain protein [Xylaria sp. FL1777]|nr:fungal-specific transcription factor domain protein [Xylaria sp. FL1777]
MSSAITPCSSSGGGEKPPARGLTTPISTPGDRPRPPSPRRRDKPQLSCNPCRRRKVRCDRLHPCTNCSSRGLGSSCVYATTTTTTITTSRATLSGRLHGTAAGLQDRIDQLENLVLGLMHQTAPSSGDHSAHLSPSPPEKDLEQAKTRRDVSETPSDHGIIRIQQTTVSYVSNSHWAAVLDSITDLRSHFAQEEETHPQASDPLQPSTGFPKPQLLYSCLMYETPASIVKSLPPRPVVDRLVSRYFNVLDIAPGVTHSGHFLREYEEFWKAPHAAPVMWVGLLFGIICLSTQLQHSLLNPTKASPTLGQSRSPPRVSENQVTIDKYKEKTIQCLILGHYTKGGPYVLETLILYFLIECFNLKDMEIGIWVLVGTIVQVAIHMGYHRDAKHFPNISPFAGEMRRRVWAMIVQLDFSVSTQLGLPRLVKESQTNTSEPRNLYDSDFDENTTELPPSRPETEITPTLYVLAKLRFVSVGVKVADVATEPRLHSYAEILELDQQINEVQKALPSSLRWNGLASSLNVPSQIIIQRIWLEIIPQELKIVLHRKFIEPGHNEQHGSSRAACFNAAMKILEFQRLVDEETQVDGLLYQNRWRVSSALINDFLLATSILCFCLQNHTNKLKEEPDNPRDAELEPVDMDKVRQLLRTSQDIWSRQCATSVEARKAVAALRYVLRDSEVGSEPHVPEDVLPVSFPAAAVSYFPGFSDFMPEYDFSALGLEQTDDVTAWPPFTPTLDNDAEQWAAGLNSAQDMDLTS